MTQIQRRIESSTNHNRVYLHRLLKKTSYELLTGNKPNLSYFRVFGRKCYILVKKGRNSKFAPIAVEGFLLGYDSNTKAYRVFNKSSGLVEGNKPNVSYFRVFGSKCYILVKKGRNSKFAPKAVEGFLLGYDSNTRAYRVFNKSTGLVEVSCDIVFDETNSSQVEQVDLDELDDEEEG